MEQLLQQANAAGLDSQQSKDVLGGVLSLLKNNLSSEDFGALEGLLDSNTIQNGIFNAGEANLKDYKVQFKELNCC